MNRFAYRTTGLAIKTLSNLSKARIQLHGQDNIPGGPIVFVINHFTRLETILMPYLINRTTGQTVWSLGDAELFQGTLDAFLDAVGVVSTRNPDRDRLIVKTLLTGEASWIIFPEGGMVKNMKIVEKGRFMISWAAGKQPPHTGAATLALRAEFYRERLRRLSTSDPSETERIRRLFQLGALEPALNCQTSIVPVNITYYPVRARENILSDIAHRLVDNLPERLVEELMTEGSMLLAGVDIDIRFGKPLPVHGGLQRLAIVRDIAAPSPIGFDDPIHSRTAIQREAVKLMEQYMTAIYGMTTVNHDHLFASILRRIPGIRIRVDDLCRRVFLAAAELRSMPGIHLHRGLSGSQLHLLCDDRLGIVKDFVEIALEKGNLLKTEDGLLKDRRKFSSPYSFHRARIDNPLDVMANAVEPLKELQCCVRRVAWLPAFWVRRKVREHLLREAVEEYTADYKSFFVESESKPMDVGMPLLVKGKSRDLGVVLCHGYLAAPLEVKGLAEYLGRQGYWVYAPRLKGHGTSPEDLSTRTCHDWLRSIEAGYAIMSNICRRVVTGGFSTGAGLALHLAARVPSVAGVFAVSAPMHLRDFTARFAPAMDLWNRLVNKTKSPGPKMEFVDNHPENPHINYVRNPISGVREIERLMEDLEARLSKITVPSLLLQASGDPVVDPKGSRKIFDMLGSVDKQFILFNFNRHGILVGDDTARVYRTISDFLARL
jgi:esterase/lipase/1-acyl-sn-glycerol-3-phosphate acyltransferase